MVGVRRPALRRAPGPWIGIDLDAAEGKNDGTVQGEASGDVRASGTKGFPWVSLLGEDEDKCVGGCEEGQSGERWGKMKWHSLGVTW